MVRRGLQRSPAVLLLAALFGLASCGFSSRLATNQDIGSVGVDIFGNETFERDLERELHVELTRAVRNLIDAKIEAPGRADVVVRGKLTRYTRRGGIRNPQNVLLQTGIIIFAEASLVERVSGTALAGPFVATVDTGFSLTGAGEEARARERALRNLSERIALDLFTASAIRASGIEIEAPEEELSQ